ncbi:MAG: hypothetical protein M3R17_14445 [Bacteroidota bacterium]|nr:hypothetical protein [Bacteroidota bacterium]
MKNLLIFTLLLSSTFLFAQDTLRVTNYYRDGGIYNTYTNNSAHEKEGHYIQYSRFGKKFIEGQYEKGMPTGVWNYYSSDTSGVLVQTLNFDTHEETFVDSNRVTALICGPRYFGGRMAQNEYIARRIQNDFTKEEKDAYRGRSFVISFSIDRKSLKVVGVSVDDKDLSEPFKAKLIAIAAEMPTWLPPVCKDKSEVWRFSVAVIL